MPVAFSRPDSRCPAWLAQPAARPAPTLAWVALAVAVASWCTLLSSCRSASSSATSVVLADGVVHHEVYLVEGPWSIHVLEIDLPRAWAAGIRLRTATSGPGSAGEKTSALARDVIAGINGDFFFASGRPLGMQIGDGVLRQAPNSRSALAVAADGTPLIAVFNLRGGLVASSGRDLAVQGLNRTSLGSGSSFYNSFATGTRDSIRADVGFVLQPLVGGVGLNDTVACRVLQVRRRSWPLRVEDGQWLAAFSAAAVDESIAPGDTVAVYLNLAPAVGTIVEGVGGGPRIVRDGRVSVEYEEEHLDYGFATDRNSRTAIGYSRDTRTLFMLTVDGGQPGYSVGMRLEELGRYMMSALDKFAVSGSNAYQVMNMDGGGSSTMVIAGEVVNRPSDPIGERSVGNALLVVDGEGRS